MVAVYMPKILRAVESISVPRTQYAPSPLVGEGWGGGVMRRDDEGATCERIALPPPLSPPHKGEGNGKSSASAVIAGLDPAIYPLRKKLLRRTMDPRVKPAGDACR